MRGAAALRERPEALDHRTPELLQVGDRLEEGAAADRDELLAADSFELVRSRLAVAPAEAARGRAPRPPRARRVRERTRGEHVQEAVPPLGRERVVQAGGRLERDARVATGLEEAAERRGRGNLRAAAAHLRAQPALGERRHLLLDPVAERQLDVGLAGEPVEPRLPARLDRLADASVAATKARRGAPRARGPRPRARPAATRARRAAPAASACSSARARRSSSSASGTERLAGGKSGAWSIRCASAARRASSMQPSLEALRRGGRRSSG